jgi:hypothetical protein
LRLRLVCVWHQAQPQCSAGLKTSFSHTGILCRKFG